MTEVHHRFPRSFPAEVKLWNSESVLHKKGMQDKRHLNVCVVRPSSRESNRAGRIGSQQHLLNLLELHLGLLDVAGVFVRVPLYRGSPVGPPQIFLANPWLDTQNCREGDRRKSSEQIVEERRHLWNKR